MTVWDEFAGSLEAVTTVLFIVKGAGSGGSREPELERRPIFFLRFLGRMCRNAGYCLFAPV